MLTSDDLAEIITSEIVTAQNSTESILGELYIDEETLEIEGAFVRRFLFSIRYNLGWIDDEKRGENVSLFRFATVATRGQKKSLSPLEQIKIGCRKMHRSKCKIKLKSS